MCKVFKFCIQIYCKNVLQYICFYMDSQLNHLVECLGFSLKSYFFFMSQNSNRFSFLLLTKIVYLLGVLSCYRKQPGYRKGLFVTLLLSNRVKVVMSVFHFSDDFKSLKHHT